MLKFACSVLLLFAGVRGLFGQGDGAQKMDVFMLPDATKPISYELQFTPNFDGKNSTFSGVANITVFSLKQTNVITLNIKDLTVTNVTIEDVKKKGWQRFVNVSKLVNVEKNEQFEIYLQKEVPMGRNLLVSIVYNGKIRSDMSGLYLSSYEENNSTK